MSATLLIARLCQFENRFFDLFKVRTSCRDRWNRFGAIPDFDTEPVVPGRRPRRAFLVPNRT